MKMFVFCHSFRRVLFVLSEQNTITSGERSAFSAFALDADNPRFATGEENTFSHVSNKFFLIQRPLTIFVEVFYTSTRFFEGFSI